MRLYRQTVEDFGLYTGLELSQQQFEALRSAAGEMSAKMRAVRIVAATNVSRKDLEQRLVHKGENPEDARQAVRWMEDLSLLDDSKTAEHLIQRCIQKGYGPEKAKQVLYEKRIPRQLWEPLLAEYPDQEEYVLDYLRTKIRDLQDPREKKRTVDALLRRGHSYSVIRQAMKRLDLEEDNFLEEF